MSFYNYSGTLLPANFISIKNYGAKGDGVTDDASAIQSALDSLKNTGGTVFFPYGTYLLKSAVVFYSNQNLIFDGGATLLQGAAINNLMRSYCKTSFTEYGGTHDCIIYGATFDGGDYTENNGLLCMAHSKNISIERCAFKNAYGTWHNLEINSSYNVKVKDCDFEGSRKTGDHGELIQIDAATSNMVYPFEGVNFDDTVCKYIDIDGCIFHDNTISPAIGNHSAMPHQFVQIHDCIFEGLTSSRGVINFYSDITDIDIYSNVFNECSKGIGTSGETYYIRDNRFVDTPTAIAGSASVAHGNMINGSYVQ